MRLDGLVNIVLTQHLNDSVYSLVIVIVKYQQNRAGLMQYSKPTGSAGLKLSMFCYVS